MFFGTQPLPPSSGYRQQQQQQQSVVYGQQQQQLQAHLPYSSAMHQQQHLGQHHHLLQQSSMDSGHGHHHLLQSQQHQQQQLNHHHNQQSSSGQQHASCQVMPSFEYLHLICQQVPLGQPKAIQHAQMQQTRHLLSNNQQSTTHYHARQAALLVKNAASSSGGRSHAGGDSGNNQQTFDEDFVMDGAGAAGTSLAHGSSGSAASKHQQQIIAGIMQDHVKYSQSAAASATDNAWTSLDIGGMHIQSASPLLSKSFQFLTCLYLDHNNLHHIPSHISELKNLAVLDLSFNKISALPASIGYLFQLRELWLFENLLESLPWQVAYLHNLSFLALEGNPVCKLNPYFGQSSAVGGNDYLRKIQYSHPVAELLHRSGPSGLVSWLRDNMPTDLMIPYPIPARQWIASENPVLSNSNKPSFSVMSFNVLCDKYATQQQYWYAPNWSLSWNNRKELILSEIMEVDADIVCLQEVDWSQYEEFFSPRLCNIQEANIIASEFTPNPSVAHSGKYRGLFQPKSRYRTVPKKSASGGGVDGCAIFYSNKFKPVAEPLIVEFNQLALSRTDFEKNDTLFERFCSKDNIALGIILEDESGRRVAVVNVHVHWDPMQTDVKFVQTVLLMEEIQKYLQKHGKCPLILCGDFNSLPNGLVYEYLSNSVEDVGKHPDLTDCFGNNANTSAMPSSRGNSGEMQETETAGSSSIEETSNQATELKRWKSWSQSSYGKISHSKALKHMFSGSLTSAYKHIDNIPVEVF